MWNSIKRTLSLSVVAVLVAACGGGGGGGSATAQLAKYQSTSSRCVPMELLNNQPVASKGSSKRLVDISAPNSEGKVTSQFTREFYSGLNCTGTLYATIKHPLNTITPNGTKTVATGETVDKVIWSSTDGAVTFTGSAEVGSVSWSTASFVIVKLPNSSTTFPAGLAFLEPGEYKDILYLKDGVTYYGNVISPLDSEGFPTVVCFDQCLGGGGAPETTTPPDGSPTVTWRRNMLAIGANATPS
jgi:hypothetical protein